MALGLFSELPLDVSVAKDGPDALRQAQAFLPDLILLKASGRTLSLLARSKTPGQAVRLAHFF